MVLGLSLNWREQIQVNILKGNINVRAKYETIIILQKDLHET